MYVLKSNFDFMSLSQTHLKKKVGILGQISTSFSHGEQIGLARNSTATPYMKNKEVAVKFHAFCLTD